MGNCVLRISTMRIYIITLIFLGTALAFPGKDLSEKEFEEKFHKKYEDPEDEKKAAEELAKEEKEMDIENDLFEKGKANFKEGLNEWSDVPKDEFEKDREGYDPKMERTFSYTAKKGLGYIYDPNRKNTPEELAELDEIYSSIDRESLPASWDSRSLGLVTVAKNQGQCGSCAAFASAGAVETCFAKAGTKLSGLDLSEQQLVDCNYGNDANGCNGAGLATYAKYYIGKTDKINHENSYPYTGKLGTCTTKTYWKSGSRVDKVVTDYSCSVEKLKKLIKTYGAALTVLYASDSGFGNYKSGVFDKCTSSQPNHAVVAIGWGTENGVPYWLIKNSWGAKWGDKGTIKVKQGTCGTGFECAAASCSKAGSPSPTPSPPPAPPASATCDVSNCFGPGITGKNFWFTFNNNGKEYMSTVNCNNSKCSPVNTNIKDACTYICGMNPCKCF